MELKQLFAGIPFSGALPDGDAVSVTMDSRRVKPGTVFVCTRGATADGHAFAAKALDAGAAFIVGGCLLVAIRRPKAVAPLETTEI